MSNFADEQLNNISQSLEEIESYMLRITISMEKLVEILDKQLLKDQYAD